MNVYWILNTHIFLIYEYLQQWRVAVLKPLWPKTHEQHGAWVCYAVLHNVNRTKAMRCFGCEFIFRNINMNIPWFPLTLTTKSNMGPLQCTKKKSLAHSIVQTFSEHVALLLRCRYVGINVSTCVGKVVLRPHLISIKRRSPVISYQVFVSVRQSSKV